MAKRSQTLDGRDERIRGTRDEAVSLNFFELASKRALVVAPHADDEVLGAGGLIAKTSSLGWQVRVLYMTVSGYPSLARGGRSTTRERVAEVEKALGTLGADGYEILFRGKKRHLGLDTVPQAELIAFIERGIAQLKPSLVVVPCRGHYHQDHRVVADACVAALRPAPHGSRPFVPAVLAYGHATPGWGGDLYAFRPSVFVDVTDVLETKLAALACYRSQLCKPPHPRSLTALRETSAFWGAFAGVSYAEPFECLRIVTR